MLHTTEGAERGALAKLSRDGEAHYLVGRSGTVYRIVDKARIAAHAGRSMWEGHQNLDRSALAVEVVGGDGDGPLVERALEGGFERELFGDDAARRLGEQGPHSLTGVDAARDGERAWWRVFGGGSARGVGCCDRRGVGVGGVEPGFGVRPGGGAADQCSRGEGGSGDDADEAAALGAVWR